MTESFKVKVQPLIDSDDVDLYLKHFETIALAHEWPRSIWSLRLLPLLHGVARDVIYSMSAIGVTCYDKIVSSLC